MTQPMELSAAKRALGEIVRRHEALRTVFREVDGVAVQPGLFVSTVVPRTDPWGGPAEIPGVERVGRGDVELVP
jgi:hypothetical protein